MHLLRFLIGNIQVRLVVVAVVIVFVCFGAIFLLKDPISGVEAVLIGFLVNLAATIFAIGVLERYIKNVFQRSAFRDALGAAAEFWRVPQPRRQWTVIIGGRLPGEDDPHLRISWATFASFMAIHDALRGLYGDRVSVTLRHISDIKDWDAAASGNLVILGGILNVPGLPDLFRKLELPAVQTKGPGGTPCISVSSNYVEPARIETERDGHWVKVDHGLVFRLMDFAAGSALFGFCGGGSIGTQAAVTAMLDPDVTAAREFDFGRNLNWTIATARNLESDKIAPDLSKTQISHTKADALKLEAILGIRAFLRSGGLSKQTDSTSP